MKCIYKSICSGIIQWMWVISFAVYVIVTNTMGMFMPAAFVVIFIFATISLWRCSIKPIIEMYVKKANVEKRCILRAVYPQNGGTFLPWTNYLEIRIDSSRYLLRYIGSIDFEIDRNTYVYINYLPESRLVLDIKKIEAERMRKRK